MLSVLVKENGKGSRTSVEEEVQNRENEIAAKKELSLCRRTESSHSQNYMASLLISSV